MQKETWAMMEQTAPIIENISGNPPRILVVEDDITISELLEEHLTYSLNAQVRRASDATEAMELDADKWAEVIIVDYLLPDMDGLKLSELLNSDSQRPMIFMTGYPSLDCAIEAMRFGVRDMFVKPFDLDRLTDTLVQVIEQYRKNQLRFKRLMRMRQLAKGILKERRALRRKLEFVCKDIVTGYRQLSEKVNSLLPPE